MAKLELTAKEIALIFHGDQQYGGRGYIHHLEQVVSVLKRFRQDTTNMVEAAWLHDVLEDTPATTEILKLFGVSQDVINIVDAVTDIPGESKEVLFNVKTKFSLSACILKHADRIANVEACIAEGKYEFLEKYRKEHYAIFNIIRVEGVPGEMTDWLDFIFERMIEEKDV